MAPPKPLAWSVSRHRQFETCQYSYFLNHHASHGGWLREASDEARLSYRMRQLTTLHAALGAAVHRRAVEVAKAVQVGNSLPGFDELLDRARCDLNTIWRNSLDREGFVANPQPGRMIAEAYFGRPINSERYRTKLRRCLQNLIACPLWAEIASASTAGLVILDTIVAFTLDDLEVFVAPDLLYQAEGRMVLVDWKTGLCPDLELQLAVYGCYVEHDIGLRDGDLLCRVFDLATGKEQRSTITEHHLSSARNFIRVSASRMREVGNLRGAPLTSVAQEIPHAVDGRSCWSCNFRGRLCPGIDRS